MGWPLADLSSDKRGYLTVYQMLEQTPPTVGTASGTYP